MKNEQRRMLVTGASGGIGRAIAVALSDDGFEVVCHFNSNESGVRKTVEMMHQPCAGILKFDVTDRVETRSVLEEEVEQNGAFWGVIVNAGVKADGSFLTMHDNDWDRVLDTNLNGFFNVLRPLVHPMVRLRSGGRIIVVSSLSGSVGVPGQANYSASKGGVEAAARSLAMELAKRNISVNSVCPGFVETEMLEGMDVDELKNQVPMRRLARASEVGALAAYLCSDAAGYITKQSIRIDGGIG